MLEGGVFGLVRHPLYLGTALWSVALIFIVQSILSMVLGGMAIFRKGRLIARLAQRDFL